MTAWEDRMDRRAGGFTGEVAGLGLADVIQLNVQNRFSGCIAFQHQQRTGTVFFRDGQIIHAAEGEREGEEALYAILAWPAGQFGLQPNVTTTRCTIQKSCEHLLLEAHRLIDERRAEAARKAPTTATAPAEPPRPPPGTAGLLARLRQLPGVTYAVVQARDGARGRDDGYQAEALAGQADFLMMVGSQLGAALQGGDLQRAAVHGTTQHLLLLANKTHYLGVLLRPDAELGAVEIEVKKELARGR